MMKTNIIKMFNLPSYIRGKSFAEASKAIEKKFEGKTDKYSNDTKEVFMKRLSEAQEYTKMQEQPLNPSQEANKMSTGGFANSQFGAGLQKDATAEEISGTIGSGLGAASTALELGQTAFGNNGIDTSGATNLDGQNANQGGMAINGALQGAQAGMQFGPWGAAVGGVVGGAAGFIGGAKKKEDLKKGKMKNAIKTSNMFDNSYALGGLVDPVEDKTKSSRVKMNDPNRIPPSESNGLLNNTQGYSDNQWKKSKNDYLKKSLNEWRKQKTGNTINDNFSQTSPQYRDFINSTETDFYKNNPRPILKREDYYGDNKMAKGGYTNDYFTGGFPDFSNLFKMIQNKGISDDGGGATGSMSTSTPSFNPAMDFIKQDTTQPYSNTSGETFNMPKPDKDNLDPLKRAVIEAGRLAPAAFNAYQLANLDKPEYEQLNRLDNRYVKDNFDEQSLINNINSNYNKNYVKESSGGSLGAYAANSAAAELNKTRAISEGFQRGESINRQENTTAQQFNLGVDQQNLNQANLENDINARNEGNYDTQKSRLFSQLGNDLGNIGKEQTFKQMVKDSGLCYDTSGAYICGTSIRVSDEQLKEIKSETNENAKGGMLDSNSMFTSYLEYLKKK